MIRHLKTTSAGSQATGRSVDPRVSDTVARIIADIRANGDAALRSYSAKLDGWERDSFRLGEAEIAAVIRDVPSTAMDDLRFAQQQIESFARAQRATLQDLEVETLPGVFLGHRHVPVAASGAYVPGGRYPLTASAHMTIIPAKVAGVERVVATTPPTSGEIPPISVAAMHLAGADELMVVGGAHAVAAMALGTESVEPVAILTGPGNSYVAEAKRQLFGEVGIDLFAGPTETLIVADESADPETIATDLLSQAEHGPDSPCVLVCTSVAVAEATMAEIERQLPTLSTRETAEAAWRDHGEVIVVDDLLTAFGVADDYASEHVQILTEEPRLALEHMRDYGALFLGESTCVPYGDKVIGTNHVLPTLGAARYTGGLWVGDFLKTHTFQEIRHAASSARIGEICARLSRLERFEGHARSGDLRARRNG